jgi:hypothetical protein
MSESDIDFVGGDAKSPDDKCPAVYVEPATGDVNLVGRRITDPATLEKLSEHSDIADDETAIWLPANLRPHLLEALTGEYEKGRHGHGEPDFQDLLAGAKRSAIHLEARDTYDPAHPAHQKWLTDGDASSFNWDGWIAKLKPAIERGVRMRRLRIVSEPISDYIRWEHAISYGNIQAGEDLRWLPRHLAYDLPTPLADYWMFDQRLIRYNFNGGNGEDTNEVTFVTDPRKILPIVGMFEMLWERGIPHSDYKPS